MGTTTTLPAAAPLDTEQVVSVRSSGVLSRESGHEQVVFCRDERSGLRAIIAIYSTALGPSLGGTRFYPYSSEEAALADVLNLSKGMAYKNALAGLDLGGGKAVIIGDPERDKSEALLRAYGRFVQSLAGRYITACDVGTYSADMDLVARECDYVTGRTVEMGGAGDSSILTSFGVVRAMQASAEHVWGSDRLWGKRIGIDGVGKVGARLVEHLAEHGASIIIHDIDGDAVRRVVQAYPGVEVALSSEALLTADLDIYAPCALGGVLNDQSIPLLTARIVCGAANNQLIDESASKLLDERGIWYAPDYVVNSGGVIQVADEIGGFDFARAKARASRIYDTTRQIFQLAAAEQILPSTAANRLAERRMAEVSGLRSLHLPRGR